MSMSQFLTEFITKLYSWSVETIGTLFTWVIIVLLAIVALKLLVQLLMYAESLFLSLFSWLLSPLGNKAVKSINTYIDIHREEIQSVATNSALTVAALTLYLLEDKTDDAQKFEEEIIDGTVRNFPNPQKLQIIEKEVIPVINPAEENPSKSKSPTDEPPSSSGFFKEHGQFRVFLCHAKEDLHIAREFRKTLIQYNYDVWLDDSNLLPGHTWEIEIQNAVRSSDIFLLCLSSSWIKRPGYIQKELKTALEEAQKKPEGSIFILPTRLDNCEVPESLRKIQYVDLFKDSRHSFMKLLKTLDLAKMTKVKHH